MKRKQHMLERFRHWYLANATEITWFIIGAMIMSGLIYFGQEQYVKCWYFAGSWPRPTTGSVTNKPNQFSQNTPVWGVFLRQK
jgi:hypothetical protein